MTQWSKKSKEAMLSPINKQINLELEKEKYYQNKDSKFNTINKYQNLKFISSVDANWEVKLLNKGSGTHT